MALTYMQIAGALAPDLDNLINEFLAGGESDKLRLQSFLWDNKVGILRVLQAYAKLPST